MEIDKLRPFYEETAAFRVPRVPTIEEKTAGLGRPITITGSFIQARPSHFPAGALYSFGSTGSSKEDIFFDSQLWPDSDCDDDFFSVNGDFTPSRGNTPLHHNFKAGKPEPYISKTNFTEERTVGSNIPGSFPKKRLADLLQETRAEEDAERSKLTEMMFPKKFENGSGNANIGWNSNSGSIQYRDGMVRQKSGRCLPGLELCRSLSGRKKKLL